MLREYTEIVSAMVKAVDEKKSFSYIIDKIKGAFIHT